MGSTSFGAGELFHCLQRSCPFGGRWLQTPPNHSKRAEASAIAPWLPLLNGLLSKWKKGKNNTIDMGSTSSGAGELFHCLQRSCPFGGRWLLTPPNDSKRAAASAIAPWPPLLLDLLSKWNGARSAPTEGLMAAPTEGLVSAPAEIADVYLHTESLITKKLTKCLGRGCLIE